MVPRLESVPAPVLVTFTTTGVVVGEAVHVVVQRVQAGGREDAWIMTLTLAADDAQGNAGSPQVSLTPTGGGPGIARPRGPS